MRHVTPAETPEEGHRRLVPLTEWPNYYPWPSVAGLRHLRFYCRTNGFRRAFVTVGRRVLVDEREFYAAVARLNQESVGGGCDAAQTPG